MNETAIPTEHPGDSSIIRKSLALWRNPNFSGPFVTLAVIIVLFVALFVLQHCLPIHTFALKAGKNSRLPLPKVWARTAPETKQSNKANSSTRFCACDSWACTRDCVCLGLQKSRVSNGSVSYADKRSNPSAAIWHPPRATHLAWTFGSGQLGTSQVPYESSRGMEAPTPSLLHGPAPPTPTEAHRSQ